MCVRVGPHFLGNVEVITALPGDEHAVVAASALIHALLETDRVAIVRFVKRNKAQPQIGVLMPHVKPQVEFFYYAKLPFLEDIRPYPFAPLHGPNLRPAYRPSPAQLDATQHLIESMDLDNSYAGHYIHFFVHIPVIAQMRISTSQRRREIPCLSTSIAPSNTALFTPVRHVSAGF